MNLEIQTYGRGIRHSVWLQGADLRQKWEKDFSSNEEGGGERRRGGGGRQRKGGGGGEGEKKNFKVARLFLKTD